MPAKKKTTVEIEKEQTIKPEVHEIKTSIKFDSDDVALVYDKNNVAKYFTPNGCQEFIEYAKTFANEFTPGKFNIELAADRKTIRSGAYRIARAKTQLHELAKQQVQHLKDAIKPVETESLRMRNAFDKIKANILYPVEQYEIKIEAEKQAKMQKVDAITELATEHDGTIESMQENIEKLNAIEITEDEYGEAMPEAFKALAIALRELHTRINALDKIKRENEAKATEEQRIFDEKLKFIASTNLEEQSIPELAAIANQLRDMMIEEISSEKDRTINMLIDSKLLDIKVKIGKIEMSTAQNTVDELGGVPEKPDRPTPFDTDEDTGGFDIPQRQQQNDYNAPPFESEDVPVDSNINNQALDPITEERLQGIYNHLIMNTSIEEKAAFEVCNMLLTNSIPFVRFLAR